MNDIYQMPQEVVIESHRVPCSSIEIDDIFCLVKTKQGNTALFTVDNITKIWFINNEIMIFNDNYGYSISCNSSKFAEVVGRYKAAIRTLRGLDKADLVKTLEARVDALEEREFEKF